MATTVTLRKKRLGRQLEQLREARNLDRTSVAADMEVSASAITQWENGTRNIRVRDLRRLLDLYGVTGEDERAPLLELAKAGSETTWWASPAVRSSFGNLLALEVDASVVEEFSATLVPGLAQTEAYARSVMDAAWENLDETTIATRLKVRMKRAELLRRKAPLRPLRLHMVLDEGAVRRQVGGDEVWREQLAYLVELSRLRNVTLQVIPNSVGAHASMLGAFTMLTFPDPADLPIVYEERLTGDAFTEGSGAAPFRVLFDALRTQALPPELSVALVEKVANERG